MPAGLTPAAFALLGAAVFFAGVVDALAGGGGLITLPAYLAAGLNPALVLGTNKLVSSIGTVAATARFRKALNLSLRDLLPAVAAAAAASWAGARLALLADPAILRPLLLCALPLVGGLIWSHPHFGREDRSAALGSARRRRREVMAAAPVGAYDGFFGPGAGTFYALALSRFAGYDLLGATARAKALNLASNLGALAAFVIAGRAHWGLGLPMAALSVAGNWTGAHLGVRNGAAVIRPAVILICAGLFLKLLVVSFSR